MEYRRLLFQIIKNNKELNVYINNSTKKTNITHLSTERLINLIFQYLDSRAYPDDFSLSELKYQIINAKEDLIFGNLGAGTYYKYEVLYSLLKIEWAENRLVKNCCKRLLEPHIHYERK